MTTPPSAAPNSSAAYHGPIPHTAAVYFSRLPASSINSFCGAMAGVASGIVTCPLDVIKTKLQAQGSFRRPNNGAKLSPSKALYNGLFGTARVIWREDGVRGMYRGLGPMLLGYLPTWAVYMSVYEGSKDVYYGNIGACSGAVFGSGPG